jgi:hypothetical protein
MRALRLVGPDEDGTSLIVEAVESGDSEGERFTLPLDDRLRSLAKAETDRQSEAAAADSGSPTPTPREIQVRVRAGESAEAVAADAGIPLERVMRFAFPVLQERVRVTDEARRARARRGGDGLLVPFGELLDSRLMRHGVDPAAVRWDAYRREDGGWTVTTEFSSYERTVRAKFSFALLNRTVSALDDIAADLLSDRPVQALMPPPPPAPEPVAEVAVSRAPGVDSAAEWDTGNLPPRLTAVPNPRRADQGRPQEASPAVRPPSRRQKAHTRPVPVNADDELFDQDAFEQQPWHEPPLPFEAGATGRDPQAATAQPVSSPQAPSSTQPVSSPQAPSSTPGRRAQRAAGGRSDSVAQAQPDTAEADIDEAGTDDSERFVPEIFGIRFDPAPYLPAEDEPEDLDANPADGEPDALQPESAITADSRAAVAGDSQTRRGRRSGEKPRMPSWDDILLGVRHKSD